jgi:tRNA pseudouridine55 synthase
LGRNKSGRDIHGILLLDKRLGVSSNRALQEVKRLFNAKKAGHTGSLDPLASGLLPICLGEATKTSAYLLNESKRYRVEIQLGVVTDTGDAEGAVTQKRPVPVLTQEQLINSLNDFVGSYEQVPPMYSALKYNGKKLYELAREGKTVARKPRLITIYDLQFIDYQQNRITVDVHCSKGTYIRSLAEEIGAVLNCGGSVTKLRRLAVGNFVLEQCHTIEQLQEMSAEQLQDILIAVDEPLISMPAINVTEEQAYAIRQGQSLQIDESTEGLVRIYSKQIFLGLGEMIMGGKLAPKKLYHLHSLP